MKRACGGQARSGDPCQDHADMREDTKKTANTEAAAQIYIITEAYKTHLHI